MYERHVTGQSGEQLAAEYLRQRGYTIIEVNFASRWAEIDIIAERNQVLYFFEVKTRRGLQYGHPFHAISRAKLRKLRNLAYLFIQRQTISYTGFRLGAIGIILQFGVAPKIDCVTNIDLFL